MKLGCRYDIAFFFLILNDNLSNVATIALISYNLIAPAGKKHYYIPIYKKKLSNR